MKVGILSDSPTVTTGFGITTNQIAHALAAAEHDVACFGIKAWGETFQRDKLPFRVWAGGLGSHWIDLLPKFFQVERLDALLVNMDIFNMHECLSYCSASQWRGPLISYLILDGVPAYRKYIECQRTVDVIVATTQFGAQFLEQCGLKVTDVAPPGVDMAIFRSLPNREQLRRAAGMDDRFVVGVFGRNTERKQQVRVLMALQFLLQSDQADDILVYLHCDPTAYWNLEELASEMGIKDHVVFIGGQSFDETAGIPYSVDSTIDVRRIAQPFAPNMPASYSYVERLNCCDLVMNVPHCGDFEQVIIEGQACGVPIAGTDDQGIMSEALGNGGILLPATDVSYWKAGQRQYLVSVSAIAQAILDVRSQPALRGELQRAGLENAKNYPWKRLHQVMVNALQSV